MIDENKHKFFEDLKNNLTDEDIINFFQSLGVERFENKSDYIIFPTICHNSDLEQASLKLYYYKNNKLFHCYTGCGETFDIFGLIKRYCQTRNLNNNDWKNLIRIFTSKVKNYKGNNFDSEDYYTLADKYKKRTYPKLKILPTTVLNPFVKYYTYEWLEDGITPETMDKFNILFSIPQNKIIIPHYDEHNNLVGIRSRALNPEDIEKGKYRPITIQDKTYAHPLSLNLYGLNINKNNISKRQCAIVFEGEKSVLLMDKYFSDSVAVASCGSNFHKAQLDLLLKYNVSEIIIAYQYVPAWLGPSVVLNPLQVPFPMY